MQTAVDALAEFSNVKRRLELIGETAGIRVYDDFAHHPTAIKTTLEALRDQYPQRRILAVLEPRSNTMKRGVFKHQLAAALDEADLCFFYAQSDLGWDAQGSMGALGDRLKLFADTAEMIQAILDSANSGDLILIMSNGGFEGLHRRLLGALETKL